MCMAHRNPLPHAQMSMACMELAAARLERWHKWKEYAEDQTRLVPIYEKVVTQPTGP